MAKTCIDFTLERTWLNPNVIDGELHASVGTGCKTLHHRKLTNGVLSLPSLADDGLLTANMLWVFFHGTLLKSVLWSHSMSSYYVFSSYGWFCRNGTLSVNKRRVIFSFESDKMQGYYSIYGESDKMQGYYSISGFLSSLLRKHWQRYWTFSDVIAFFDPPTHNMLFLT